MRRRSVLLALPAGLLTLAACGGEGEGADAEESVEATQPPQSPQAAPTGKIVDGPLPEITEGKAFGEAPTVAKGQGEPSSDIAVQVLTAGTGATVAKGDYLQFNYLGQIWDTAKVFDSSFERGKASVFQIGIGQLIPAWDQVLVGKKAGSRIELGVPPAYGYGEQGQPQAGIEGDDTLVFVIDVVGTFNGKSSAQGEEKPQDDDALPTVGTNTDGAAPAIELPGGQPPKDLVADYVIEGDGAEVESTDAVLVQYKGVLWDGGKEFDSTYGRGQLAQFGLDGVVEGWSRGLTGKKVGSRVMIVVPPDLGYGESGQNEIPGGATLVFSVDILAVV
ncbi:FKBP-type peptidyl-prolyl cis-trans isomerase [Streptomyces sp. TRM 70351]|uniref:FKBP-type peptidyl-prolyl cis-trans isomerase n=1 Tax=Streptomyces sp. TRM 70351 TaxID=3116552 RepID=UPI002E7AC7FD|nr:FKBP-type peptidyl-prolyl cis-trans isomerase [Streptomyces sp. TRM 70351]MEE1929164.1 FKBP-type peptidyl-prolyl cis-trans isomerase [Streptomyces sp. TRM 70351]